MNCFIEITKRELKKKLKDIGIRSKYHHDICNDTKRFIEGVVDFALKQSITARKADRKLTDFKAKRKVS